MNKSIEYIKNRILNNPESVNNMPINGWDDAKIINPIEMYLKYISELKDTFVNDNEFKVLLSSDSGKFNINVEYDPDSEFDYFTTKGSTHDGTILFTSESIQKLLYNLLQLGTIPKSKVTQSVIDNPFDYDYKYIIGDVILHQDFGMKNINGNTMYGQTDIVVLPIKFEYSKIC